MTDTNTMLLDAFKARALEEAKPLMTATENAHSLLADFSTTIQAHAEHKALADILAFLKQNPPPVQADMAIKARELRTSLLTLLDAITPWTSPEAVLAPVVVPPVVAPIVMVPPAVPTPTVVRVPAPALVEPEDPGSIAPPPPMKPWANDDLKALLARLEVEFPEVAATPCTNPDRVLIQLKAMVAECRHVLASVPTSDPMHRQATNLLRRLGGILTTFQLDGFVYGLAHNHFRHDWMAESAPYRRQLGGKKEDKKEVKKADEQPDSGPVDSMPEWLSLRQDERPILLVGNYGPEEKIAVLKKRYNVNCEWVEITNPGAPVDAIVQRLHNATLAGVVLLEGFLGHTVIDKVRQACTATKTPWTYGGRGGVGALRRAFDELDRIKSPG